MAEFVTPDFLKNSSTDELHQLMREIIPKDIDMSEGGHAWNMTRPTAMVSARIMEFILPECIKLIFPEWSYGEFLDGHAKSRSMKRRPATAASGEVTITGSAGTIISAGSLVATAAVNGEPSVEYKVLKSAKIPEEGTLTVDIQCTQTGIIGNTQAHTIVLLSSGIKGVKSVTNEAAVTGGTAEESDESLIERILEHDQGQGSSFTGSAADYKRWAMEVAGVGTATVIPAQDDSGTITIILTDANGDPATEQLCTDVYNHIMKPDNPENSLANVNAFLRVEPPSTMAISIKATVELKQGETLESVKTAYMAQLALYLPTALEDKEIKYNRIHAALTSSEGVNDFTGLQFGIKDGDSITYGTSNIAITSSQLPTVTSDDLILTAGVV